MMPANVSALVDERQLTLDMVHQFAYCPRRYHLMYVEGRWADNVYTIDGRHTHRRVDKLDHVLPDADAGDDGDADVASNTRQETDEGDEPPVISRSVPLSSDVLGLTAKLDLVSSDGQEAVPVDTKRGRVPSNSERSWEPERVQLMAQGLLLREHGYRCDHGVLYFAGSRTRVDVPFTPELEAITRQYLDDTHRGATQTDIPLPLEDSPKCNRCSLNGICLPDETLALRQVPVDPAAPAPSVRRLYPARPEATPLYVQEQGAYVGKKGATLVIRKSGDELATARIKDVSQLVLCGNVQVSTQTIHQLCEAAIPVVYLSMGHWFYGVTAGMGLKNAFDRVAQFQAAQDPSQCLAFARQLVADKGVNQRAILRRNGRAPDGVLRDMAELITQAQQAPSLASLLGIEGSIARFYFQHFGTLFHSRDLPSDWDFNARNRRPPRDPINAMLSFCYAMLVKECTVALLGEGLEPHWGLYHQPRHGRPALALDVMEPLRPLIADSAVVTAVNTGMIRARHFTRGGSACLLQPAGRKAMIQAFEARLDQLVTHPAFDYRCSWRSAIRLHARLLARHFRGDVPVYASITTR
ncbi:MAG: CRISPR-associated endonuclease Cas1 [Phycisphaeraceae bacterium]